MAFRDDEAARQLRIETLEKELAAARTEHGQAAAAEREKEAKRDELGKRVAELEEKLREAKREPEPEKEPEPAKKKSEKRAGPRPGLLTRAWSTVTAAFWPVVVLLGASAFLYCSIQDCRSGCRPIDRFVELDLPGEVSTASGVNMPQGTRCTVHAVFFADRDDELHLWESEVAITCAGRKVFDGEANNACSVQQARSAAGWAYTMPSCSWSDDDLSIHWVADAITLSSSTPSWSYTIRVPSPMESRQALYDPVLIDSRLSGPTVVTAEVIVISGASPVLPGASCVIDVQPQSSGDIEENCTISVRCDQRVLRSTRASCGVRRGELISASGLGVTVDFTTGLARVQENEGPGVPFMASLRFTPK